MATLSKTSIFNRISEFCDRENLFFPDQTLIVGLSGGPDSVFLLHYLLAVQKKYNLTLIAAHLDHGWRKESAADTEFCKRLCVLLGITLVTAHLQEIALTKKNSGSAEETARNARRAFFEQCAREHTADAIALAHHQDDAAETFFIRLVRGSGLTGLTGIKAKTGKYIRPLLSIRKKEMLDYLQEHTISYCYDATNADTDMLRNNIRHNVLPVYDALDTRAHDNLMRSIEQLQAADTFIEKIARARYSQLFCEGMLDIDGLLNEDAVLMHRILLQWLIDAQVHFVPTEKFFAEIVRFLQQPGSKTHTIMQNWALKKIKRKAKIIA